MKEQRTELVTQRPTSANLPATSASAVKPSTDGLTATASRFTDAQQQEVNLRGSGCATNGYSLGRYPLAPVTGQHSLPT